ncbi:hypothetical protein KC340_g13762 [Hortaea werneckii]|nr:hypothetical protein KC342_g14051 [Hortaea werneckii]KAI7068382.1 hypothetical protein KC339_g15082 [Hortaea werneckii]KAI7222982.1 hypothetical protein KC365_g11267 [Hortaea werneckii]KAI7299500.1 hypothetical protein KC340_g13762 [Hortaea werneckii]KAI7380436.1 hypothetical protein KC328_g12775 [Hortaea werneckii]
MPNSAAIVEAVDQVVKIIEILRQTSKADKECNQAIGLLNNTKYILKEVESLEFEPRDRERVTDEKGVCEATIESILCRLTNHAKLMGKMDDEGENAFANSMRAIALRIYWVVKVKVEMRGLVADLEPHLNNIRMLMSLSMQRAARKDDKRLLITAGGVNGLSDSGCIIQGKTGGGMDTDHAKARSWIAAMRLGFGEYVVLSMMLSALLTFAILLSRSSSVGFLY